MLTIKSESFRRVTLIKISGRVDSESSPQLDDKLKDELKHSSGLVLDLSAVEYMSSAGLRAIVSALRAAKKNDGNVILSAPSTRVREVLDLAGLDSLFEIKDNNTEAVGAF